MKRQCVRCVELQNQIEILQAQSTKICEDNAKVHREIGPLQDARRQANVVIVELQKRVHLITEHVASLNRLVADADEYSKAWFNLELSRQASTESRTPATDSLPQSSPASSTPSDGEKP
jgi:chromosome segregation ATPase